MRLLFVVQAYGADVFGGAETACRELATRMAARDHRVEVLTSCATSYVDWADVYPPGTSEQHGVVIHRLPVAARRDLERFGPVNGRAVYGRKPVPLYLQRQWMQMQGPKLPALPGWLQAEAGRFDAVSFFTYLYWTTWAGLPACAGRVPTVLHPLAHDEAPLYLPLFDTTLRLPDAFAFLTREEQALVTARAGKRTSAITGLGVPASPTVGDVGALRRRTGLGDRPYVTVVGRVERAKGVPELVDFFVAYKERRPSDLALLIVGTQVEELPAHDDVIIAGPLDEPDKQAAMAGAQLLVQPSPFESFSIVLMEAWVHSKAALVNGHSDVLLGHARRSGGAVPYFDFAGFEGALDLLLDDAELRDRLGRAGRSYVTMHARWDTVLDRYERMLTQIAPVSSRERG